MITYTPIYDRLWVEYDWVGYTLPLSLFPVISSAVHLNTVWAAIPATFGGNN